VNVYLRDSSGLVAIAKDGTKKTQLQPTEDASDPWYVKEQTRTDLVAMRYDGLWAVPKSGATARLLSSATYDALLATNDWVFAIEAVFPNRLVRIPASGGPPEWLADLDPALQLGALTASRDYVYVYEGEWQPYATEPARVTRVSVVDGHVEQLEARSLYVGDHLRSVRGTDGFFAVWGVLAPPFETAIAHWSDETRSLSVWSTDVGFPTAAFGDDTGLYVVETESSDIQLLERSGMRTTVVAGGVQPNETGPMALDAHCIYVVSGNSLLRFPRPD